MSSMITIIISRQTQMANNLINKVNIINRNAELNINLDDDDINCTIELCDSEYLTLADCSSFLNAPNSCNFLHLNCRSLPKNFDTFSSLITHIDKPFLALGLTETWLKPHNADIYALPGYKFISCSRPTKLGGGVGIYINMHVQFNVIQDLTIMCDVLESVFVEVVKRDVCNSRMLIGCIYRPPNSDVNLFNEQLSKILKHTCLARSKEIVIIGDFNLNLLFHGTNNPQSTFLNIMLSYSLL